LGEVAVSIKKYNLKFGAYKKASGVCGVCNISRVNPPHPP